MGFHHMRNEIRVADEIWLAAASLHRKHPDREDFAIDEIMTQAESNATGVTPLRPGVKVHVYLHCVANRPPNPGRYRMLFETTPGRRRLYRSGDPCHPRRTGGKDVPNRHDIPECYRGLLDWYFADYTDRPKGESEDPILALRGLGKEIWGNEDADDYVHRLREGWR